MPKVLHILTRMNVGGVASQVIQLCHGLGPAYEAVIVSGKEAPTEGSMVPLAERLGLRVIHLNCLRREIHLVRDAATLLALILLIRAEKPDIVHTHMAKAGLLGRLAARACGVPVVVHTFHGHVLIGYFGPLLTSLFLAMERLAGMLSNQLVAVNDQQRNELITLGVAPARKLTTVHYGLDLSPLLKDPVDPGPIRARWGVSSDALVVGIVARLVAIKGHELFLDSAREIGRRHPETRFVVVGDGERRAELEDYARRIGAPVTFVGWETDLPAVYAALDVVCLTSFNEGSPVALMEALAAGKPVVATAAGGVPDVISDGENGLLVLNRDPEAFAAAVCRLLESPDTARQMGQHGREWVVGRYDASRLASDVIRLYDRLLAERRLCCG